MKPKFNEDTLSEQPAIEQLKRLQYEYIHGDNLDPELKDDCERTSRREVVLIHRLKQKLAEINPHLTEDSIDKAIRRITHIQAESLMEANQKFHQDLIAGISIDQDIGARRQKQTVRFIDFDDTEKNEFLAVNQFWVKGPKQTDRPDIVLFVNGIPSVVIECKSPVAKQTGISNAVVQLKRYQEEIPQLFYYNQICIGLNLFGARYGTILSGEEFYHEWKEQEDATLPNMADHPAVQEMLKLELIARDIVEHFNQKIRPNGFKAQLVAADRTRAIQYKQELDKLIDPERSEVVITVGADDPQDWKENYRRTRANRKTL